MATFTVTIDGGFTSNDSITIHEDGTNGHYTYTLTPEEGTNTYDMMATSTDFQPTTDNQYWFSADLNSDDIETTPIIRSITFDLSWEYQDSPTPLASVPIDVNNTLKHIALYDDTSNLEDTERSSTCFEIGGTEYHCHLVDAANSTLYAHENGTEYGIELLDSAV